MTPGPATGHFSRHQRLLDRRAFDNVFKDSTLRLTAPGFLLLARENTYACSRLGMIISKRTTPTAVKRNMIKRIIREAFRQSALDRRHLDIVVLLRSPVNALDRSGIRQNIGRLFEQLVEKDLR